MLDVEQAIAFLQSEAAKAQAAIATAQRQPREIGHDRALGNDLKQFVANARHTLSDIDLRLRLLYESKSDDH